MTDNKAAEKLAHDHLENVFVDLLDVLSAVKQLSELSCLDSDEEVLIKKALSTLVYNQDMERCSFFKLVDNDRLVNVAGLSYLEAMDDVEFFATPQEFKIGEGLIGLAAQTRALQHCHNSQTDERLKREVSETGQKLPGSIISVPVFAGNLELVGVLNVSHPEPYFFTEWHIRLLEIYKNILGQMISNFRLFHKMETEIVARTAKLQQSYDDIKRLKEHYQHISVKDELTGLFNRRHFYNHASVVLARFYRYHEPMCLLLLDLDHFKKINDTYGHAVGDDVLIAVADTLQKEVRECDILVRFGGEEFVIIFTNTSCENGIQFATRIRKKIAGLKLDITNPPLSVSVSIGVFCLDPECYSMDKAESEISIDQTVHYADTALYQAKKQGRNCVVRYCQTDNT